jgi:hypothetical protein
MARPASINVIAAFRTADRAKGARQKLQRAGVRKSDVRLVAFRSEEERKGRTRKAALRSEMQDEVTEGWAGPSIGFMTPAQAKGVFGGVIGGVVIGALFGTIGGLAWGLFADGPMSGAARFLFVFIPCVIGFSAAGFIIGGAMKPRLEGMERPGKMLDEKKMAAERDTLISVSVKDETTAVKARKVLEEAGAERVDAVDASGQPLPPESEPK